MKNAEEWERELQHRFTECAANTHYDAKEAAINVIKQIQLDAYKTGMTRAVNTIKNTLTEQGDHLGSFQGISPNSSKLMSSIKQEYNNTTTLPEEKE